MASAGKAATNSPVRDARARHYVHALRGDEVWGPSAETMLEGDVRVCSERARAPNGNGPAIVDGAPGGHSSSWRGHGTVLVVDDDSGVREVMRALLEHRGFAVLTAPDGRTALEIFRRCVEEIRLVILDLVLPDTDGEAVFRLMRQVRPGLRAILCSGRLDDDDVGQRAGAGWSAVIRKPFRVVPFLQSVRTALDS